MTADPTAGGTAARSARVAVLVPVCDQAAFLGRALASLVAQDMPDWEALVVDDGSLDHPWAAAAPFLTDPRIRFVSWSDNRGLGAALNTGLDATTPPLVAYLPADDLWDRTHLRSLCERLDTEPAVALAWSGVRCFGGEEFLGAPPGSPLQLVQVAHRRTADRWLERSDLETDDLERLFWKRLESRAGTGVVTCTWVDHPRQRHKAMRESYDGGLNVFRRRYRVQQPLRFDSTDSGRIDEVARYAPFRNRRTAPDPAGLRILIVGELAFNGERVVSLAERGHRLFGLWTDAGLGDAMVGPVPFGHVTDVGGDWRTAVRGLRPDVVWAQLNWRAVPLAVEVRRRFPHLPFVWHFKEAPQRSIARGEWPLLAELFLTADGCLLATEEERDWVLQALPGRLDPERLGVLDGDLPPEYWAALADPAESTRLSAVDGEPHTVVLGRPLGFDRDWVCELLERGVHLHLYGQVRAPGPKGAWQDWYDEAAAAFPDWLHLHPAIGPADWVSELSRYDAGWLHRTGSANGGDLGRASWDDLNSPARLAVLMVAGLPVLVPDTTGHTVAVQRITQRDGTGLLYHSADDVADVLRDAARLRSARAAATAVRHRYTFDHHVDRLVELFKSLA